MRISVKGRYALAAVVRIASGAAYDETISVNNIAETLGISKIYLEQVFSQLKKAGVLVSVKGPRGGYQLSRPPAEITAWDILSALELGLIEKTEETVRADAPDVESVMQTEVFEPLDKIVQQTLSAVTLRRLLDELDTQAQSLSFMLNL